MRFTVAATAASVLGTTLVLPLWAQRRHRSTSAPLSEQKQESRAWVSLLLFEDEHRILEENETHSVDDDDDAFEVQDDFGPETINGTTTMTPNDGPNGDDDYFDNQTQSLIPTEAPTIENDVVHMYRSGAYEISYTADVDCDSILNTTWFTGTCCSLSEEVDGKCKLSVNDGICKTSGPYWSLEFVSTATENGCPASEYEVPIVILDTELPVTMFPSVSPSEDVDLRNATSLGLLEQPAFCQDQSIVPSVACLNDTVMGGIWYAVTGTEGDAILQLEWDCNVTTPSLGVVPVHILSGNNCSELDCVTSSVLDTSVCDVPEPTRRLRPRASSVLVPNTPTTVIFHTQKDVSYFVLLETEEFLSGIPLFLSDITEDAISSQPSMTPPPTPMSTSTAMPTASILQPTEAPSMPPIDSSVPTSSPSTNASSLTPTTVVTKQSSFYKERKWFGMGIMLLCLLVVVFC